MLGIKHIIYMFFVLVITFVLHKMVKSNKINFDKFLKVSAIIAVCLDPLYWVWEYIQFGYLDAKITLPLYICSLFWYLTPIIAFSKKRGIIYRMALSCLSTVVYFGAILGMVLNNHLNNYSFWHFIPQRSLFYHALMFWVITIIWSSGYYKVGKKDNVYFMAPLFALLVPAYIVDKMYGYDYCYFNGGSGTAMDFFIDKLGMPLFLTVLYGGICLICYTVLSLIHKKQKKING